MPVRDLARKALKLVRIARHPALLPALRHGAAAAVEHCDALAQVKPRTIVDAGANVGQFSLIAACLHPEARIFAFEPVPRAASVFRKVFNGNPRVSVAPFAIGATSKSATLHLSARDDSSSLLPLSDLQVTMHPETGGVTPLAVQLRPLADLVPESDLIHPALLKIDVQGAELEVVKGCAGLLHRFDHIYVELSFVEFYVGQPLAWQVIDALSHLGFVIAGIYNLVTDKHGRAMQADFLFEPVGKTTA